MGYSLCGRKESDMTGQPKLAYLGPPRKPLNATEDPKRRLEKNKELLYSWMERPSITKISILLEVTEGLPGGLDCKESTCQRKRLGFHPWVGRIPWSRKWQPTPVFLPGKCYGQRSLAGHGVTKSWT